MLASHLKMPVQRVKQETTASEFVVWSEYLKQDHKRRLGREKLDYYLAQILCEIRRSYVKNPQNVKSSDFFIEFTDEEKKKQPITREEAAKASKRRWFGLLGMKETV